MNTEHISGTNLCSKSQKTRPISSIARIISFSEKRALSCELTSARTSRKFSSDNALKGLLASRCRPRFKMRFEEK